MITFFLVVKAEPFEVGEKFTIDYYKISITEESGGVAPNRT
jgi:hypothetical protein